MLCLSKFAKKLHKFLCYRFHNFGGKSRVSDLVRHRKSAGSNTSLPEMINNSAKNYDSSSAVSLSTVIET